MPTDPKPQTAAPSCTASPEAAPASAREYLRRCAGAEELVVCWTQPDAVDPQLQVWVVGYRPTAGRISVTSFPFVVSHWSHQIYGGDYDLAGIRRELAAGLWQAPEAARQLLGEFIARLDPRTSTLKPPA